MMNGSGKSDSVIVATKPAKSRSRSELGAWQTQAKPILGAGGGWGVAYSLIGGDKAA
jgi:hypothetical protein